MRGITPEQKFSRLFVQLRATHEYSLTPALSTQFQVGLSYSGNAELGQDTFDYEGVEFVVPAVPLQFSVLSSSAGLIYRF
ncbi:MAG TPA: hypothetical protein DCP28_36265 [Cytophagales bacterium]|nr:hypothetical protein [Cytophagales bacterium]